MLCHLLHMLGRMGAIYVFHRLQNCGVQALFSIRQKGPVRYFVGQRMLERIDRIGKHAHFTE